jgi:hypothetical protein
MLFISLVEDGRNFNERYGHEWPRYVVSILILILKNIHLYIIQWCYWLPSHKYKLHEEVVMTGDI